MKTIITFIIITIIVGLICFGIGYYIGKKQEERNQYGIKKNKRLKL